MFRSIRWTLLFWYGLILILVIAGFGGTLYFHLGSAIRNVRDTRLREWAQAVARGYNERHGEHRRVSLSDPYARALESPDPEGPYYIVWNVFGKVITESRPGLEIAFPEQFRIHDAFGRPMEPPRALAPNDAHTKEHQEHGLHRPRSFSRRAWPRDRRPPVDDPLKTPIARNRGPWREVIVRGGLGTTILVGQNGEEDRRHLQDFLMTMLAASAGAFGLAMVGGWFLAEWTLAPISRISETASSISASNLSKRIDVTRTESELGKLARILNVAFARLEDSFVRQTQFTADASHELRTPLAVVMSHCELALRKERSPAEYRSFFETSLNAARRMKAVVEGLLTLARADASAENLEREIVPLDELVEECVSMLRPLASPSEITLDVEMEPLATMGDRDRLRELVANLVTNGIRYNQVGGSVFVRLRREEDFALLTVTDTGIGIREKDQPHIFERFYRADPVRSREIGGTGLGLAIAKWIAEAHGGSIEFTSQEGAGTTFLVRLPVSDSVPHPNSNGAETGLATIERPVPTQKAAAPTRPGPVEPGLEADSTLVIPPSS